MSKYRKKPVVIEAMQFLDNTDRLCELSEFMGQVRVSYEDRENPKLLIETLEGEMAASVGDYIIKGVNGEFYPCKPDIFEKTYDQVGVIEDEMLIGGRFCAGMSHHLNTQKITKDALECPVCGKPLYIQEISGVVVCSDSNCEYGHA